MRRFQAVLTLVLALALTTASAEADPADARAAVPASVARDAPGAVAHLGPRPFFLADDMAGSALKQRLQACAARPSFARSRFAIGHRGAPLQYPEHTRESYLAAVRSGAGIVECDVTFTKDKELVCRHAQDDLATTTNILLTPLAERCTRPFVPARLGPGKILLRPATAECRSSDITLAEFKTLRGKMDSFDPRARTPEEFQGGLPGWRTDLQAGASSGTLMSHRESIELLWHRGVQMAPELKRPVVPMPYDGMSQSDYARKMIDEYRQAGVPANQVWPQSFQRADLHHWLQHEPDFARQAVYLESATRCTGLPSAAQLAAYRAEGVRIVGAPLFALLRSDGDGRLVASEYAQQARDAGLEIMAWTLERSGRLADGGSDFYTQTFDQALSREGDVYRILDALVQQVGVRGVFTDWPATVVFYANCMGLE